MSTREDSGAFERSGMYPEAVEEFEERLPKVEEGDYLIGGGPQRTFQTFRLLRPGIGVPCKWRNSFYRNRKRRAGLSGLRRSGRTCGKRT